MLELVIPSVGLMKTKKLRKTKDKPNIGNKRWVSAPSDNVQFVSGMVTGIYLAPHEDVQWTYQGNKIIGYTIFGKAQ